MSMSKQEKVNESVRKSREKEKTFMNQLNSNKESLQKEREKLISIGKVEQGKNDQMKGIVGLHNKYNPGASGNPIMQSIKSNTSNPTWGAYDLDKPWNGQKDSAQAWKNQYTPSQSWKNGPK